MYTGRGIDGVKPPTVAERVALFIHTEIYWYENELARFTAIADMAMECNAPAT